MSSLSESQSFDPVVAGRRPGERSIPEQLVRPGGTALLRLELVVVWLFMIVASYFLVTLFIESRKMKADTAINDQHVQTLSNRLNGLSSSVDERFKATNAGLSNMTKFVGAVSQGLDKASNSSARALSTIDALKSRQHVLENEVEQLKKQQISSSVAAPGVSGALTTSTGGPLGSASIGKSSAPGTHPTHVFDATLKPAADAHVVLRPSGDVGWQLVKPGAQKPVTVSAIKRTTLGVLVHCWDDDHDYYLTKSGGWIRDDENSSKAP